MAKKNDMEIWYWSLFVFGRYNYCFPFKIGTYSCWYLSMSSVLMSRCKVRDSVPNDSIVEVLRAEHKQREGKGKWTKTCVWHLFFAGETRQLHIVWLMYLSVQPDLEHRVREGNEEIWWLALLLSQTNVGSSAHCSTLTPMHACTRTTTHTCIHTHTQREKMQLT